MSKSALSTLTLVFASSLLLAGCQAQPTAKVEEKTPSTAMAPASAAPGAAVLTLVVAPGEKIASVETTYQSPAGEDKVGFKLAVDAKGVITDAQTDILGASPASVMYQKKFAEGLHTLVKGKKLSELTKIDRVGGSSLTTGAFNKALDQLKASIKS
jgi:hypothetical protein